MSSRSASLSSDGEIVESDSDKATKSLVRPRNTNVDRPSRQRSPASRSPGRERSPRRGSYRSRSRSPYRESRGSKRRVDDDHYDRTKHDPRRFKVSYEGDPRGGSQNDQRSRKSTQPGKPKYPPQHERHLNGRKHEDWARLRSRSPYRKPKNDDAYRQARSCDRDQGESKSSSKSRSFNAHAVSFVKDSDDTGSKPNKGRSLC